MSSRSRKNTPKRRPGAQPGNTNALKHGFYSAVLDRAARETYLLARDRPPTDLTEEIALLRERLTRLIQADPDHMELLVRALGQLARLAATHYHLSGSAADQLSDAMHNVLEDIERTLAPQGES